MLRTKARPKAELSFQYRPGTQDEFVFSEVVRDNCYGIPDLLLPTDIVIDCGAHIGSFTVKCVGAGAGKVYAYEASEENYELLEKNVGGLIGVKTFNMAVWRSDKPEVLTFSGFPSEYNACGTVLPFAVGGIRDQIPVKTVGLDDIIKLASEKGKRRIRLLKVDIEGAEYAVLGTSKMLELVDEIVGECHEFRKPHTMEVPGFKSLDMDELETFLNKQGFKVKTRQVWLNKKAVANMMMFTATRNRTNNCTL